MDFHSTKTRLVTITVVATVLASVFTFYYFPIHYQNFAEDTYSQELTTLTQAAALSVGIGLSNDDFSSLNRVGEWLRQNESIECVALCDESGGLVSILPDSLFLDFDACAVNGTERRSDRYLCSMPITVSGELFGYLVTSRSLDVLQHTIEESRVEAGIFCLLLLLGGLGTALLIGNAISRPLNQLMDATTSISQGDYTQSVHVTNRGEFGALASRFNTMVREIAERSNALRKAREQLENTLNALDQVVWSRSLVTGDVLMMSPAALTVYGRTADEFLSDPSLCEAIIHPDDRELVRRSLALCQETESSQIDYRVVLPRGVIRWVRDTARIAGERGRQPDRIDHITQDITSTKLSETVRLRLAAAVEQSSDMITVIDREGIIEYVNPAYRHVTGFTASEILGTNLCAVWSADADGAQLDELRESMMNGQAWKGRFSAYRKTGELYYEDVTISPVIDTAGVIINFIAIRRDVTEEIQMLAQLQQSKKLEAVGTLAAGVAHEINTPIQFIGDNIRFLASSLNDLLDFAKRIGDIVTAEQRPTPPDPMVENLEDVLKSADIDYLRDEVPDAVAQTLDGVERVATIVRAMKDFSHPEQKDKSSASINSAIESTLIVARNELKYVADVVTHLDETLPAILCFPSDLKQVFLNILVNAAHAIAGVVGEGGDSKGTITVSTRRDGDDVVISISDTGTGIPEHARDRIFEHFFTTKEVGKGTGQGLAIARSVVEEKHSGSLTFETEIGKGTTFHIRLPMNPDEPDGQDDGSEMIGRSVKSHA